MSRIRSVTRRYDRTDASRTIFVFCGLNIDTTRAKVFRGSREITLTPLECRLLLIFARNPGRVLSRTQLLEALWDYAGDFVNDNTLTVYIRRLREKLGDDAQNPRTIQTVRGIGYVGGGSDAEKQGD